MPRPKRVNRRQVRIGILVLIGAIALATGILFIGGKDSFFVPQYGLKVFFPSAGGLRNGAQVRLDGIRVGNVRRIAISSYSDPDRAVEIDLDIARKYQQQIRGDSVATMETTGLLGETYVDITRGTQSHEVLKNGGVLQRQVEPGMKEVMENVNGAAANFRDLGAKLTGITNHIQDGQGSIGKMVHTHAFSKHVNKTVAEAQNLINQVNEGHGALAKFFTNKKTLHNKTVAAMDHVDHILDEVQSGNGTMGKLIKDQTLLRSHLNEVATNTKTMAKNISNGKGSLGRLATDRQFHNRISDTVKNLDTITTRMAQGKGTLGRLSTDSQLLQNANSSIKLLKEFLTEFRKSPRKYLTVHFRVF
jgi:phospholipid/cholesterol/gamma-HCH transport system substrate-binding protein